MTHDGVMHHFPWVVRIIKPYHYWETDGIGGKVAKQLYAGDVILYAKPLSGGSICVSIIGAQYPALLDLPEGYFKILAML